MAPSSWNQVVNITWLLVSLISFIYIFLTAQKLLDPFYPTFVSSVPGNLYSCSVCFFLISVCASIFSYFDFLLSDGPISIFINVSAVFIYCFCSLSFIVCYGTKMFFDKANDQTYQRSINSCSVDGVICDQFKQTIGDISMPKLELQSLVTKYIYERTMKTSISTLIIMTVWICLHSIYLNFLFNGDESKEYNEAQIEENGEENDDENIEGNDISQMSDVEKEDFKP